jgi:dTDP-4-amino-4,6-dideoxygalactose transaminase
VISVFGSKVGGEELEEVRSSLEAQWMGIGPKTKAFEAGFSQRLGLTDLALVDSGSNGLYLAIKLLGLPPGAEIIVPSFTWIACAHAVVLAGCVPVFCDVDVETQNCSPRTIEPCLTKNTGAIMVVHYAGKPVDMDGILRLGKPVIEDAAHAVDSYLDGKACGAMGAVGVYSFDAVKNLAMGEGGGVTARDPELVAKARLLRYCGIGKSGFQASADKDRWWEYHIVDFMPKFLPSDVHAAIGLAQLRKLDSLQAYRKKIWELFQGELASVSWLARPIDATARERHSYFTYFVRVLNGKRDKLAKYLYEQGIYTTLRYHPLHLNPIYKSTARLPNSERLNEEGLNLPLHPNLSESDLEKILTAVRRFGG